MELDVSVTSLSAHMYMEVLGTHLGVCSLRPAIITYLSDYSSGLIVSSVSWEQRWWILHPVGISSRDLGVKN